VGAPSAAHSSDEHGDRVASGEVACSSGAKVCHRRDGDVDVARPTPLEGSARVFLSTTSDAVRVEGRQDLGDALVFTRGAVERLQEDGAGERQALMDLLLLSRCKHIVASVHSTFSYAAHALAGVVPHGLAPFHCFHIYLLPPLNVASIVRIACRLPPPFPAYVQECAAPNGHPTLLWTHGACCPVSSRHDLGAASISIDDLRLPYLHESGELESLLPCCKPCRR
jgi:hypothetical protein